MLQSMGSERLGHNLVTEQQQYLLHLFFFFWFLLDAEDPEVPKAEPQGRRIWVPACNMKATLRSFL